MVDSVQTKWPYVDYRPYKLLGVMAPIGAIVFFIPLPVPTFLHTSIALIVVSGPPAVLASRLSRERSRLENALPDFIADVTEGRKTGLSPEQAIERLSSRNYGVLSKHVKKMGAQLSWGISLSKVVSTFTSNVGSWVTRAIGVLLIEVVDVGGGTIRSFTEMATFTRTINDLEGQKRSALRPFVFVTYIAGVMIIMTTFILVYFLSAPSALGFGQQGAIDPHTIDLLLTTAVFDSFIIGLVAGKFGEGSVADGFKHAVALVIACLISIVIAKTFINIPV
jgi:flagellar protein FlaJ